MNLPMRRRNGRTIMTDKLESLENYNDIRAEIVALLDAARTASARSINAVRTATYWAIGRRIFESEMRGTDGAAE